MTELCFFSFAFNAGYYPFIETKVTFLNYWYALRISLCVFIHTYIDTYIDTYSTQEKCNNDMIGTLSLSAHSHIHTYIHTYIQYVRKMQLLYDRYLYVLLHAAIMGFVNFVVILADVSLAQVAVVLPYGH